MSVGPPTPMLMGGAASLPSNQVTLQSFKPQGFNKISYTTYNFVTCNLY